MTSDLQATNSGANQTSFSNAGLASGNYLFVDVSAVANSPTALAITVTYTVD